MHYWIKEHKHLDENAKDMKFSKLKDFWVSLCFAITLYCIKTTWIEKVAPILKRHSKINPQHSEAMRTIRSETAADHTCRACEHASFAIYFFIFLRPKDWAPWFMGGTGELSNLYKGFPFVQMDEDAHRFMILTLV